MHSIMVQDLRFQLEEGFRYICGCMGLPLPYEVVALLVNRTEGWVSGLHLAALSLKRSDDPFGFIREFGGQQRDISNYLLEELFERQAGDLRDFLLTTSILSRMNHSICEAVAGQPSCQEQLEMLERIQLFIVPLDERREWYRYHHLFADFLQQRFQHMHPELWARTHENAARWLEDHGFAEEAVEHLLAGRHHAAAASLIEKHLSHLRLKRTVLRRWLSVLPENCIAERPGIQSMHIKILAEVGLLGEAAARLRIMEHKLSDPDWQPWNGAFLPMAAEFFLKWIKVWECKENYPFVGYFYTAYSELMYEWNRLEEAQLYADRAFRQKQMQTYARILVHGTIGAARVSWAKGDSNRALGQLGEALNLSDRLYRLADVEDRPRDKIKVLILQSLLLNRQGDLPAALMKLESALHLAGPQGYVRSFVDEGSELANLLAEYLRLKQQNFIRNSKAVSLLYVKRLLQIMKIHTVGSQMPASLLTQQEMKILKMIGQGLLNKQMAEQLQVSAETVKMHLKHIYRKLEVNSRLQAVQRGKELNLH